MIEFPTKLQPLFEDYRYKILVGGRGGSKSWSIARALLIKGAQKPLRILCAREIQKSITDSVLQLLEDQAEALGLSDFYEVQKTTIIGKNGTTFDFAGLKHNKKNLKSYEGADICWVEEADQVSNSSWNILVPTIRKEGSEIWISFNPDLYTDPTYQRYVVDPPEDAIVIKINYLDNPWCPQTLINEANALKEKDEDSYRHIWLGECKAAVEGAVFSKELQIAEDEERITEVPYDPSHPVMIFLDIGYADGTAVWFVQKIGFKYLIIDFYFQQYEAVPHYLKMLSEKPYSYSVVYLPHDAEHKHMEAERTTRKMFEDHGFQVEISPKINPDEGISAAVSIFGQCYFDKEKTADGVHALRHYRYKINHDEGKVSSKPVHDWASHPADAFQYFALSLLDQYSQFVSPNLQPVYVDNVGGALA
jgi:phage terminase large subunit